MKRILFITLSLVIAALVITSCTKEEEEISFEENLIVGKWQSGTLFERYDADKNGVSWDTADDVTEEEAQAFTWTITKDQLEQIHIIENGGSVPKVYTITTLNATVLTYKDDYGSTKTFSKVE